MSVLIDFLTVLGGAVLGAAIGTFLWFTVMGPTDRIGRRK